MNFLVKQQEIEHCFLLDIWIMYELIGRADSSQIP